MAELIFELGCEELPASQVAKAAAQLAAAIASRLEEAHVQGDAPRVYATPRRLIVGIAGLPEVQPDQTKRQRGPSLKACFDASGAPTKALEGFLKGQMLGVEDLEKEEDYVWATRTIPGRPTLDLLSEILPQAVQAISFDKTMRWGSGRMRFARPIRWLAALLDGALIPFELEGLASGTTSKGHRFMSPGEFPVPATLDGFLEALRDRMVEPDPETRRRTIREQIESSSEGRALVTEDLVDENIHLTEWPMAACGWFREDFLTLPEPVLVTAMAKHERMFPVRGSDGRLTNRFVFVRNGGEEKRVLDGNAWVLNARFNDARFFYDEDSGKTLDDFLALTETMTFQAGLGTVRQRADRLASLMKSLAVWGGEDQEKAAKAGLYAKADLSSGLVSELSSLQGIIGGEYAAREGFDPAVAQAIGLQYSLSSCLPLDSEGKRLGALLVCADQLDKLAACLGTGLAPTGSSDPYALRRAATLLIEASLSWPAQVKSWEPLFDEACSLITAQGIENRAAEAKEALKSLFAQRLDSLLEDWRYDVRSAAVQGDALLNPRQARTRCQALSALRTQPEVVQSLTRPLNLVASAEKKGVAIQTEGLAFPGEPAAEALLASAFGAQEQGKKAVAAEDGEALAAALTSLRGPIDSYLEGAMVMVEDEAVRAARLGLLRQASLAIQMAGDVGALVLEG